jgi:hypothetical protein
MNDQAKPIADQLPVKVTDLHNERGVLCLNLCAPLNKYEGISIEELWRLDPINVYLKGEPLDLEDEQIANPFE